MVSQANACLAADRDRQAHEPVGREQAPSGTVFGDVWCNLGVPRNPEQLSVRDFIDAGRLLWVIYPDARYAMVHRPDGSAQMVLDTEALDGETIVPSFRLDAMPWSQFALAIRLTGSVLRDSLPACSRMRCATTARRIRTLYYPPPPASAPHTSRSADTRTRPRIPSARARG